MNDAEIAAKIRLTVENIPVLSTLPEMEWRTAVLRLLLRGQTGQDECMEVCADVQQVLNRDVLVRLDRMASFLEPAQSFFHALGAIGNGMLRAGRVLMGGLELLARIAKPLFWVIAIFVACYGYWMTGSWHMPDWWAWFIR